MLRASSVCACVCFREAATPSLPAQSPAVTPHPHALASSAIYYAPSYAGRSRLSNPWPLVGEILPTVVEEGAGKRKRGVQLCTVCGHEKSSQKWKDLHGPKTCCKHSEACKASNGIQCRLVSHGESCNPEFCQVPKKDRMQGHDPASNRKHRKKTTNPGGGTD